MINAFEVKRKTDQETTLVEEAGTRAIMCYPTIFPNRWAFLSHVLMVNGNGYYWDGEHNLPRFTSSMAREPKLLDRKSAKSFYLNKDGLPDIIYPNTEFALMHKIDSSTEESWLDAAKSLANYHLTVEKSLRSIVLLREQLSTNFSYRSYEEEKTNYIQWRPVFQRILEI